MLFHTQHFIHNIFSRWKKRAISYTKTYTAKYKEKQRTSQRCPPLLAYLLVEIALEKPRKSFSVTGLITILH